MEIIVTSRGMKAGDILDMAYDLGLERPKIATAGEWDGGRIHILTYGPLAYRKTMEIHAPAMKAHVEQQLRAALVPGAIEAAIENSPSIEILGTEIIRRPSLVGSAVPVAQDAVVSPKAKPKAKRVSKAAH